MALHIADAEVSQLLAELARQDNASKTETLRKLLRREVDERKLREQRRKFMKLATQVMEEGRKLNLKPVTKQEMDELSGL